MSMLLIDRCHSVSQSLTQSVAIPVLYVKKYTLLKYAEYSFVANNLCSILQDIDMQWLHKPVHILILHTGISPFAKSKQYVETRLSAWHISEFWVAHFQQEICKAQCTIIDKNWPFYQQVYNYDCTYHKTSDRSPRLLSVQTALTSGLYPGPGLYVGPVFYRNVNFCQNRSVLPPMLYSIRRLLHKVSITQNNYFRKK